MGRAKKAFLDVPSTINERIFSGTDLLSAVPVTHSTAVHFPNVRRWIRGAATAFVRRVAASSTL
jgi:hypothetical protein